MSLKDFLLGTLEELMFPKIGTVYHNMDTGPVLGHGVNTSYAYQPSCPQSPGASMSLCFIEYKKSTQSNCMLQFC